MTSTEQISKLQEKKDALLDRIRFFSSNPTPNHHEIANSIKAEYNEIVTRLNDATRKHAPDPISVLPLETFIKCLELALPLPERGYTAALLLLTLVSKQWSRAIISTPTLWSIIAIGMYEEDPHAKIATSLNLSGDTMISLTICPPVKSDWEELCGILMPFVHRIQHITFIEEMYSEGISNLKTDRVIYMHALEAVLKSFENLPSIISINLGTSFTLYMPMVYVTGSRIPNFRGPQFPQNTLYMRNWILWPSFLVLSSLPNLQELYTDEEIDTFGHMLDKFPQMERLCLLNPHGLPIPKKKYLPKPMWQATASSYNLPNLTRLKYDQPFSQTVVNLLPRIVSKLTEAYLRIPCDTVPFLISTLQIMLQLRTLTLVMTTEHISLHGFVHPVLNDTHVDTLRSLSLHYETETHSVLWKKPSTTHVLRMTELASSLSILYPSVIRAIIDFNSETVVQSLLKGMQKIRFLTLNETGNSACKQVTLPCLEELHTKGETILPMLIAPNLLCLNYDGDSIPPLVEFCRNCKKLEAIRINKYFFYTGRGLSTIELDHSPFSRIRDLQIQEEKTRVLPDGPPNLYLELFPTLTRLSLGGDFSPGLATFTCLSLLYKPEVCPKLEEITFNGYPEWDVLFLMLETRNLLTESRQSRISKITLSAVPNHLRLPLASLLRGEFTVRPSNVELSFEGTREIMFNQTIPGCFTCMQNMYSCDMPIYNSTKIARYHSDTYWAKLPQCPISTMVPLESSSWILARPERREVWDSYKGAWGIGKQRDMKCKRWFHDNAIVMTGFSE